LLTAKSRRPNSFNATDTACCAASSVATSPTTAEPLPSAFLDERHCPHERFLALAAQHDVSAPLRESDGRGLADTLAGAGHDDDTAGELLRHAVMLARTTSLVL
jgi:hypothetical protein